jgi:hypothetical protein
LLTSGARTVCDTMWLRARAVVCPRCHAHVRRATELQPMFCCLPPARARVQRRAQRVARTLGRRLPRWR